MLRVLTKAEELAMRAESFARLQAGMLFDLGRRRSFMEVVGRRYSVAGREKDGDGLPTTVDTQLKPVRRPSRRC